ncbi:MAG: hypothetical protein O3A51_13700, partial [Verrucomicrobia bacterium]|nr:hypothetical protein [Verrucomicrobiota bacterium]
MPLVCGTATVDLTPEPELLAARTLYTAGFWYNRALAITSVRDPIQARVCYLADHETKVAIISWESLGDGIGLRARVAAQLASDGAHDIRLFLASTHSHTVPDTIHLCGLSL